MRTSIYLFALTLYLSTANGQSLRFVRTDPTADQSVVTATKLFGLDVVVSGLSGVTAVSAELRYTNAQYIRLAAWKPRQLGRQSVYVIDRSDTATGTGSISIGVLSGETSTGRGIDSPTVVHLDFAVLPNAPHLSLVQFDAINAEAVVAGTPPQLVPLSVEAYTARIHGFVWVFPGDANNDGRVDQRDYSTVALYLGQGTASGLLRGYRRQPASTQWQPQAALAWDDARATYADCDGSGDITLADALVVSLNFDSTHAAVLPPDDQHTLDQQPMPTSWQLQSLTLRLPYTDAHAVALELTLPPNRSLDGITAQSDGWTTEFFQHNAQRGHALCVMRCTTASSSATLQLELRAPAGIPSVLPVAINGYLLRSTDAAIVPLDETIASIEVQPNQNLVVTPQPATSELSILAPQATVAQLYTLDGQLIATTPLVNGRAVLSLASLCQSLYWLVTDTGSTVPIVLVR